MENRSFTFWDIDWSTIALFMGLALLGWAMIYASNYDPDSTASMLSLSTTAGKQFLFIIVSAIAAFIIFLTDPHFFKSISYLIYGVSIFLLIFVLAYGSITNGATSWINLPGGFKFQPSELTKFATCLTLATYLSSTNVSMKNSQYVLIASAIIVFPAILIVIQGDAGSALVFFSLFIVLFREGLNPMFYILAIIFVVLFILGLVYNPLSIIVLLFLVASFLLINTFKSKQIWLAIATVLTIVSYLYFEKYSNYILISTGLFLLILLLKSIRVKRDFTVFIALALIVFSGFTYSINYLFYNVLEPHQRDRINVWLMPENADPRGSYYNLRQSKLTIGSGGLTGKGYLEGEMTQGNFVPEQHTDFIFTVVGEEQGFLGALGIVVFYLLLLLRLTYIAERQRSQFTRDYAYGIAGIFAFHLLINVGMTLGLMPVIGIPLPLMSYGGSSLLSFTIMVAVLLKFDGHRLLVFR